MNQPFGEIIESSLAQWKAHCWQWNKPPAFGSLVVIKQGDFTFYGIVAHIQTGSVDAGRYPFPYQKTEEELLREQPQIFMLIQTHVVCVAIGFHEKSTIFYQQLPYPANIHSFVRLADVHEIKAFFAHTHFLTVLASGCQSVCAFDELLLAVCKYLADYQILEPDYLHNIIESFSLMLGNDYRRLKAFLQRVEVFTPVPAHTYKPDQL